MLFCMAQAQHQEVAIVKGTHISTRVILTEALLLPGAVAGVIALVVFALMVLRPE